MIKCVEVEIINAKSWGKTYVALRRKFLDFNIKINKKHKFIL